MKDNAKTLRRLNRLKWGFIASYIGMLVSLGMCFATVFLPQMPILLLFIIPFPIFAMISFVCARWRERLEPRRAFNADDLRNLGYDDEGYKER